MLPRSGRLRSPAKSGDRWQLRGWVGCAWVRAGVGASNLPHLRLPPMNQAGQEGLLPSVWTQPTHCY